MSRPWSFSVALCIALLALAVSSELVAAANMTVTTTFDDPLGGSNGRCSLREAIVNANGNNQSGSVDCPPGSGPSDTITVPAGTYLLTITGGGNNGDLDITTNITINGAGRTQTIVDGAALNDRVFDLSGAASATITGMTIQHGNAGGDGGGVHNNGTATLRDVLVFENTAGDDGAGVMNETGATLTMIRTSIRDNESASDGGGMRNDGTATMTDGDITGNTADADGGGVRNDGTLTLTSVLVRANIAADTSGGIENRGTVTMTGSSLDGNQATDDGGGMQNQAGATLTMTRSAVVGNFSGEDGGGIDFDGGTANLTNVTISGNTAAVDGGGFDGSDGATINLLHVTIANNTAGGLGNGIFNDPAPPATITARGSIIANNGGGPNCAGIAVPVISTGFNLEFPGNSCGLSAPTDRHADPRLAPLANNGGPTLTHGLLPGSAAIDTATNAGCPPNDQRGEPRPFDGDGNGSAVCDIGAYEVVLRVAESRNDPTNNDDDDRKKETEEQRQQRERTNRSNKSDYVTEGNVLAVERPPDGKHLLVTIGLTRNETLIVQITCVDLKCPDVRVGDYLEADGYQNGVGDPNSYFIAEDFTVLRGGKKVK